MKQTVLVIGLARSGTSVVAGIIHHLGCDMGPFDNACILYPNKSYEDKAMTTWANVAESRGLNEARLEKFRTYVAERNKRDVWGFKTGSLVPLVDKLLPYLRNPFIVWVWRNPLHGTKSDVRALRFHNEKKIPGDAVPADPTDHLNDRMAARMAKMAVQGEMCHKLTGTPHLHVAFEDVKGCLEGETNRICRALALPRATVETHAKIREFFVPGYCSWNL
jgi:hypothetical protein